MPSKLDWRLIKKFNSKTDFEKFLESFPPYIIKNNNKVTCQLCTGKNHQMKQIYFKCTTDLCNKRYKTESLSLFTHLSLLYITHIK